MIEVQIESALVNGVHRIDTEWPLDVIHKKLETITGIPPSSQEVTVNGEPFTNTFKNLKEGANIFVKDKFNTIDIVDDGNVENRYQMDQETYEKREDTVLNFKRQNKLGRFGTEQTTETKEVDHGEITVAVGDECYATLANGKLVRGVVEFIGEVKVIEPGNWIGVKLFSADGKNNGTVKGVKLFDAPANHGALLRPNKVRPLSEDEEEI